MNRIKNTKSGSVYPFLDTRTPKKNSDLLPVKISVTLKGEQFRIGVKLYAAADTFKKAISGAGTISKEAKILRNQIDGYLEKAEFILEKFPNASKEMFTNLFKSESDLKGSNKTDLSILFQSKIDELIEEDRAGSKSFYEQALKSFQKFRKDPALEDIDVQWLKAYKAWFINQGNSHGTAQIYMRSLRHIYNRAVKEGFISSGYYPFKDYTIGTASKSKDVLYPEQLKKLWEYEPVRRGEERSKDFFFFLYLSNGMNLKDALSLKGANLNGDMLNFVRAKTSKTKADVEEVIVYLHPEARRILEKWGDTDTKDYLFPFLRNTKSDIERKRVKDILARNLNRDLRIIGEKLGFDRYLTLNLARHSFATMLNINGTPISHIKDFLGHSSTRTSEIYIKTLPSNKFKDVSATLLDFTEKQ